MQTTRETGKLLAVKNGWLLCPKCGRQRVLRIYPETRGEMIQVYCRMCRRETIVNIEKGQCHEGQCR